MQRAPDRMDPQDRPSVSGALRLAHPPRGGAGGLGDATEDARGAGIRRRVPGDGSSAGPRNQRRAPLCKAKGLTALSSPTAVSPFVHFTVTQISPFFHRRPTAGKPGAPFPRATRGASPPGGGSLGRIRNSAVGPPRPTRSPRPHGACKTGVGRRRPHFLAFSGQVSSAGGAGRTPPARWGELCGGGLAGHCADTSPWVEAARGRIAWVLEVGSFVLARRATHHALAGNPLSLGSPSRVWLLQTIREDLTSRRLNPLSLGSPSRELSL